MNRNQPNQDPYKNLTNTMRGLRLGRAAFWGDKRLQEQADARTEFRLSSAVQANVDKLREIQHKDDHTAASLAIEDLISQLTEQQPAAEQAPRIRASLPVTEWSKFGEVAVGLTGGEISGRSSLFQYIHRPAVAELLGADGLITHRRADNLLKVELASGQTPPADNPHPSLGQLEASVATSIQAPVLATEAQPQGADNYYLILPFGDSAALTMSLTWSEGGIGHVMSPAEIAITVANPFAQAA